MTGRRSVPALDGPPRDPHDHQLAAPGHSHAGHVHAAVSAETDRRWLFASLSVIVAFMAGEVVVGLLAGSLALLADAGHMLTDAGALALAIVASRLAQRPARGSYTYGFARVDAVSAQANGITLLLLAGWFAIQAVRRLFSAPEVQGGLVLSVALIGIVANLIAVLLASQANKASLNVRGAVAHVVTDLWAFVATAVAGAVILLTGWSRADAVASLVVAALMVYSGLGLVRAAGRVFLEAAPAGLTPRLIGQAMAAAEGVVEVHDLHVWDLGGSEPALSAHVVVDPGHDCHRVAESVRSLLAVDHGISHATLQADHSHDGVQAA
ncbi:MAG: cobalt-zinc-cadmium efflux system protein, partial [Pseudonocardiales bacterium]|nr:cobalt-zinc-cadmium efflux system protein [Pseudonocardiales bacterium]